MKISGIYQIQSKIKPNRIYIGSAVNINKRWQRHLWELKRNRHNSEKLQRHYNKYGLNDLCFSIILGCDKEDLIKTEQYFIDSYNPYFNTCKIAGSVLGRICSEETKQKISISNKGKINSEDTKQKISETVCKLWKDPVYRKKLSIIRTGKKHTKEHCLNISKALKGKIVSEETRKKLSKAGKGKIFTIERRRNISNSLLRNKNAAR